MASEPVEALPDDVEEWLAERADSGERSREELLALAVDFYRFLERRDGVGPDAGGVPGAPAVVERLDALDEDVAALSDDVDEKIEDVRERVIQVKREADGKAPAEHDHPELTERVDRAGETAVAARDRLDDLEARLEDAADRLAGAEERLDRVDEGFDNYEEVLEYLTETTDDLETKVDALARAAIGLRRRVGELESVESERRAAEELRRTANRRGITAADCEACGSRVSMALLTRPRCPGCEGRIEDVEPSSGFFGSATLRTGDSPALEGGRETAADAADAPNSPDSPDSPDELFERVGDE